MIGKPVHRTIVHPGELLSREVRQPGAQRIACHRMQAEPLAMLVRDDKQRRVTHQTLQTLLRIRQPRHGVAKIGMQQLDDRDARQEPGIRIGKPGEQRGNEVFSHACGTAGEGINGGNGIGSMGDCRQRELQAERPALGHVMQPGAGVGLHAGLKVPADQRDRLVQAETQQAGIDFHALAIWAQPLHDRVEAAAGRHHDAQVGWQVVKQVDQRIAASVRQPLGLIQYEHDIQRKVGNLAQPCREPLQQSIGCPLAFQQPSAECSAPAA